MEGEGRAQLVSELAGRQRRRGDVRRRSTGTQALQPAAAVSSAQRREHYACAAQLAAAAVVAGSSTRRQQRWQPPQRRRLYRLYAKVRIDGSAAARSQTEARRQGAALRPQRRRSAPAGVDTSGTPLPTTSTSSPLPAGRDAAAAADTGGRLSSASAGVAPGRHDSRARSVASRRKWAVVAEPSCRAEGKRAPVDADAPTE